VPDQQLTDLAEENVREAFRGVQRHLCLDASLAGQRDASELAGGVQGQQAHAHGTNL